MKPSAHEQFARLERDHWWFRGRRAVYLRLLADAMGGVPARRVLDVGAGAGGFLEDLTKIGEQVLFTEFDGASVRLASERGVARGMRARAESLPLSDGCVDLVCLFDVIEHIEDDAQALHEVRRVLEPGGKLILSVPAHGWLYSRNDEVAGHVRRYGRDELLATVRASGLNVTRCTYANGLLFPGIACALLASKLAERTVPTLKHSEHTNLSWKVPRLLNELLYQAFRSELCISRRWNLPMGHSLLLIAEKQVMGANPLVLTPRRRALTRSRRVSTSTVPG